MSAPEKHDEETRARAVRMCRDRLAEGDGVSQRAAREGLGGLLGVSASTLRNWIRRELGEGVTLVVKAGGQVGAEVVRLRCEVARLRRASAALKTASAYVGDRCQAVA